jgi:hypothetical protein
MVNLIIILERTRGFQVVGYRFLLTTNVANPLAKHYEYGGHHRQENKFDGD